MQTFHGVTPQDRYLRAAEVGKGLRSGGLGEEEDWDGYRKIDLAIAAYSAESDWLSTI